MAEDQMKTSFKYYKQRKASPNYTDVIDFNKACDCRQVIKYELCENIPFRPVCGLTEVAKWEAYTLKSVPGFVFIVNPFQNGSHLYWVKRCLQDYHMKPSKTNLDIHMNISETDNIWDISQKMSKPDDLEQPDTQDQNPAVPNGESVGEASLISKLRWTTVGYHHDWNTKVYSKDNFSPVPVDLAYLSSYVATAVGCPNYQAEAAIINYYHLNSTLSGHTDHSEEDKEAPLISISFGQTAIFLLGGLTKEEKPVAMYLRSGDIVIMMGPSRLRYHGIPRVISDDKLHVQEYLTHQKDVQNESHISRNTDGDCHEDFIEHSESCKEVRSNDLYCKLCFSQGHSATQCKISSWKNCVPEINARVKNTLREMHRAEWLRVVNYMDQSRINMNVRQVFIKQEQSGGACELDFELASKRLKTDFTQ